MAQTLIFSTLSGKAVYSDRTLLRLSAFDLVDGQIAL